MRAARINSAAELAAAAPAWNALWRRADATPPTARAETICSWLVHFAPRARFRALAIETEGELVAALPLAGRRLKGLLQLGQLPANPWSSEGELLVETGERGDRALDFLSRRLGDFGWPLLWLEGVNREAPQWQRFCAALVRQAVEHEFQPQQRVALVEPGDDWDAYERRWSKNHRKNMRRARERLEQAGTWRTIVESDLAPEQVEPRLRRAFQVEDRSWKGLAGSSVLRSQGIFEFYSEQARLLAQWGALDLSFLELNGEPIAFEYGYHAGGAYFSHKVGYDERFADFGPGQLLMCELLHRFHADPERRTTDCLGPISDAVERWATSTYSTGRLIVAPRRLVSRALLGAYRAGRAR